MSLPPLARLLPFLLGVLLTGCGSAAAAPVPAPAPSSSAPAPAASFGGTDLAWIELVLAMDEQVLPLLDIVPAHAHGASVQDLASRVRTVTLAELPELRALHDEAGLPAENPHEGMPMPGMVTARDVTAMAALSGEEFDTAVTAKLREGIEQAADLARSEGLYGAEPRTKALAARILTSRTGLS
ncbi:DUF305 domain-containing protein [Actinoplanes sp. NPDC051851]|uniref:DUF305 domain-containing protein n=1 Tax=Actinoplanes sp. NPDC051851 TaxID=3154753 RepID=UPI00343136EE